MIPGAMALAGISYRADFRASDLVSMTHASRILAPHLLSQKCENWGISVIKIRGIHGWTGSALVCDYTCEIAVT